MKDYTKVSRYLSYLLRHKPEDLNLNIDKNGWVSVKELLEKINETKYTLTLQDLSNIVETDNKGRYSFRDDKKTYIRANQGHSTTQVNLDFKKENPPDILYHGTSKSYLSSIRKTEIKPMTRQYVHLSSDIETATKVGARHGEVVVIEIDAKKMFEDGFDFFISDNGVWLTKVVSPKYFLNII